MLKPVLCAAALALTAAVAIPAIAQQSPQTDNPPAAGPSVPEAQIGPEGRGSGPAWRGYPRERYSEDEGPRPRWREWSRRFRDDNEDYGPGRWRERRFGGGREGMMPPMMDHGPMMGREGMMRPFGMADFCGRDGGRMGQFMIQRIERATQPTAEQRPNFDKLKDAIGKASEIMRGACTTERPVTPPGRLAVAEKRLTAMLDAVRTVRPALDAYYGTLTDEQKAQLIMAQPNMARRGMEGGAWRQRMERWRERRMHRDDRDDDRMQQRREPSDEDDSEHL